MKKLLLLWVFLCFFVTKIISQECYYDQFSGELVVENWNCSSLEIYTLEEEFVMGLLIENSEKFLIWDFLDSIIGYPFDDVVLGFTLEDERYRERISRPFAHRLDFEIFTTPQSPVASWVKLESPIDIEKIYVFDIWGRRVLVSDRPRVDLSNQLSGTYIFKVFFSSGQRATLIVTLKK